MSMLRGECDFSLAQASNKDHSPPTNNPLMTTFFLSTDELVDVPREGKDRSTSVYQQIETFIRISTRLPPHMVRNSSHRLQYSLAPAAFAHVNCEQLENYIALVRQDDLATSMKTRMLMFAIYPAIPGAAAHRNKLARLVQCVLTILGKETVELSAIAGEMDHTRVPTPVSESQATTAYSWLQANYKLLQGFTGMRGAGSFPAADDKQGWTEVLAHVMIDQFGLECVSTEDGRVRVTKASFWEELDIDVPKFTAWLRECPEEYESLGPLPAEKMACTHCKEVTSCRFQGGLAVCEAPMEGAVPHRDYTMPLDVIKKKGEYERKTKKEKKKKKRKREDDGAKDRVDMEGECDGTDTKEDNGVEETLLVDRLLEYVGFAGGRASTNAVTLESMRQSIEAATPFTAMEISEAFHLYEARVDLTEWTAVNVESIKRQVDTVLALDEHTRVCTTRIRSQRNGVRVSAWKLH
jgi:hypothetical protein